VEKRGGVDVLSGRLPKPRRSRKRKEGKEKRPPKKGTINILLRRGEAQGGTTACEKKGEIFLMGKRKKGGGGPVFTLSRVEKNRREKGKLRHGLHGERDLPVKEEKEKGTA